MSAPLVDHFGRVHQSLRISVTDRCNIRCTYCMPAGDVSFLPAERWMSFDEIVRATEILAGLGITKVRLTGGEPLMRPRLEDLVQGLVSLQGIQEVTLTTNGILLPAQASKLRQAGLKRINISLDTLQEEVFQKLSRREGVQRVLDGIESAIEEEFEIRLNALVLRDVNLDDVIPLVQFARSKGLAIRFIEFMPLDADRSWNASAMVSGSELRKLIANEIAPLVAMNRTDSSKPSSDFTFEDGKGIVGFIDSVSTPFCSSCNRIRLTADGKFRNCLFGQEEWNILELLRSNSDHMSIEACIRDCVAKKHPSHGISDHGFQPPARAMYQIGG